MMVLTTALPVSAMSMRVWISALRLFICLIAVSYTHLDVYKRQALGDVAMTIPVVHSLAVQYPQLEITVLSRAVWQPLFQGLPANVSFIGADLTGKHKGLWGLNTLYSELKAKCFDYVADRCV